MQSFKVLFRKLESILSKNNLKRKLFEKLDVIGKTTK